jgi:hypothetical protein
VLGHVRLYLRDLEDLAGLCPRHLAIKQVGITAPAAIRQVGDDLVWVGYLREVTAL